MNKDDGLDVKKFVKQDYMKVCQIEKAALNKVNLKTVRWIKDHLNELKDSQEVLLVNKCKITLPMEIFNAAQTDEELDAEEKAELEAYKAIHPEFK